MLDYVEIENDKRQEKINIIQCKNSTETCETKFKECEQKKSYTINNVIKQTKYNLCRRCKNSCRCHQPQQEISLAQWPCSDYDY